MNSIGLNILVAVSLLLALLPAACLCKNALFQLPPRSYDYLYSESYDVVSSECSHKLRRIKTLNSFSTFMSHLTRVMKESTKPKRGLFNLNGGLRKCFEIVDQLRDLESILETRTGGVCRMSFVEKLLDFNFRHLTAEQEDACSGDNRHQDYTGHIFSLIAHQVAFKCKSNLAVRLRRLQEKSDCFQEIAPFLPPGTSNDPTDLGGGGGGGGGDDDDEQEVNSLGSFLKNFKRIEDLALFDEALSSSSASTGKVEPYFDVIVSPTVLDKLEQLKRRCRERQHHYFTLFAPIVSLAQIGFEIPNDLIEVDQNYGKTDERLLRCWLASAQLCQGLLRTHVTVKTEPDEQSNEPGATETSDAKKLVGIKFGPLPSDLETFKNSRQDDAMSKEDIWLDFFSDLSPKVASLVSRRESIGGRTHKRVAKFAKRFVASLIDGGSLKDESARRFVDLLTRDETPSADGEKSVAFCGKKRNPGLFLPGRLVTDDADTIVQSSSFFLHKAKAVVVSSAVAVCLSAVFVWFTLYALAASLRRTNLPDANDNFKNNWRQMRDERIKTIDDKVKRRGWKDKMMVYKSPTG